ncbi:MAG TPA: CDP-alcohol phosphatidyltransferase family protein [Thermoanaerobaculia bacterium]|jgi:cardiolipin synthase|nr:CDP-alcohol phosphatidyltransferase family protein [Thermoanaerobaculia bacterium]
MLTIPNLLTLLRLLLVPFFIAASIRGMFTVAFVLLMSAAATDILDGMIARRFNQRSRLGAVLDPAADKTMMISGYLFYTFSNEPLLRIPGWLTFVVLIRDFLIIMFAYLLYTRVRVKRFPPSIAGKASTVLQAATLGTTIGVNAFVPSLLWLAEALFRIALVVTLYSSWDYLRRGERLLYDGLAAARLDGAAVAS